MTEDVKLKAYNPGRSAWKGLKMALGAALAVGIFHLTADAEFAKAVGDLCPPALAGYVTAGILGLGVLLRNRQKQLKAR